MNWNALLVLFLLLPMPLSVHQPTTYQELYIFVNDIKAYNDRLLVAAGQAFLVFFSPINFIYRPSPDPGNVRIDSAVYRDGLYYVGIEEYSAGTYYIVVLNESLEELYTIDVGKGANSMYIGLYDLNGYIIVVRYDEQLHIATLSGLSLTSEVVIDRKIRRTTDVEAFRLGDRALIVLTRCDDEEYLRHLSAIYYYLNGSYTVAFDIAQEVFYSFGLISENNGTLYVPLATYDEVYYFDLKPALSSSDVHRMNVSGVDLYYDGKVYSRIEGMIDSLPVTDLYSVSGELLFDLDNKRIVALERFGDYVVLGTRSRTSGSLIILDSNYNIINEIDKIRHSLTITNISVDYDLDGVTIYAVVYPEASEFYAIVELENGHIIAYGESDDGSHREVHLSLPPGTYNVTLVAKSQTLETTYKFTLIVPQEVARLYNVSLSLTGNVLKINLRAHAEYVKISILGTQRMELNASEVDLDRREASVMLPPGNYTIIIEAVLGATKDVYVTTITVGQEQREHTDYTGALVLAIIILLIALAVYLYKRE